ncbi:transposase [Penicillium hetheringtonii]|uniref:Transposase n=1 Tax=Penicillium hetheringtonii TaxID=911720 RepID=A0AAD6DCU9_9EURO|nr:transposase [Penicillium hetheringtonii]
MERHIDLAELPIKNQQNLNKVFQHDLDIYEKLQVAEEQLAIAQNIISNIRTAQTPLKRTRTRRQIKPLSDTGTLSARDANRSIETKRVKDTEKEKRREEREWIKRNGRLPKQRTKEEIRASEEAEKASLQRGDLFWMDPPPPVR